MFLVCVCVCGEDRRYRAREQVGNVPIIAPRKVCGTRRNMFLMAGRVEMETGGGGSAAGMEWAAGGYHKSEVDLRCT